MRNLSGPVNTNFPRIDGGTLKGVLISSVAHTWPAWPTETADKLHLANFRPVPTTPCVSEGHTWDCSPGADYLDLLTHWQFFFGDGTVFSSVGHKTGATRFAALTLAQAERAQALITLGLRTIAANLLSLEPAYRIARFCWRLR